MKPKPVLVGVSNPHPGFTTLSVYKKNSSGYRLWKMIQDVRPDFTDEDFMSGFIRYNMEDFAGPSEIPDDGGTLFLLGREVQQWFGAEPTLIHPQIIHGRCVRVIPHPSGLNHFYNDPDGRRLVAMALVEECGR